MQIRGSIELFWVKNGSIRISHQNDEVTSVTHIEEYLCGNNNDGDSAN